MGDGITEMFRSQRSTIEAATEQQPRSQGSPAIAGRVPGSAVVAVVAGAGAVRQIRTSLRSS
jgi:hypothetical protein